MVRRRPKADLQGGGEGEGGGAVAQRSADRACNPRESWADHTWRDVSGLAEEPRGRGDFRLLRNVAGCGGWARWRDYTSGQAGGDRKRIGFSRRPLCATGRAPSSVFLSAAFRDVLGKNLGGRSEDREQQTIGR